MINGSLVIDAVVHPFNLSAANQRVVNGHEAGKVVVDNLWGGLHQWNPESLRMSRDMFEIDQSVDLVSATMFLESDVDIAVNHALPLHRWLADGGVSVEKNLELAEKYADRWLLYAMADPMDGLEKALGDLDAQAAALPGQLTGLKLYPSRPHLTRRGLDESYRLDDERLVFPILDRCLELGLRSVAIHKAVPIGPSPLKPFEVSDIDVAAGAFPELSFEVVHGGMAFVEETAQAIARYPNVYVNLETTFMLIFSAPALFEDVLGTFVRWGGYEKLLFSSGMTYAHPQHQLDLFKAFTFSDQTLDRYGLRQITDDDKALVLSGNFARLAGLDVAAMTRAIADDAFAVHRRENGLSAPWSHWSQAHPPASPADPGPGVSHMAPVAPAARP
jgi:predicted TIM-barrel fold metal-dependent hydrolase